MRGPVFDKYEVLERLAAGGMGEVLLARQTGVSGFERLVILKTLLPELARDQQFIEQFLDEARVAATLSHPNVVSVFEVGAWDGTYYLAMEYIPGPTVSQLMKAAARAEKRVPLPVCARVVLEAALGLEHAHSATDLRGNALGVVHRDVSPQNVMVRNDGLTKVVDFGIARAANRASKTRTGAVKGKLAYMAPEQLGGRELDGRADQFALGVVLWELCMGRPLFARPLEADTLRAVLTATVERPSMVIEGFPTALEDVLMRMLNRDAALRYERCGEAAAALEAYLKGVEAPSDHAAVASAIEALGARPDRTPVPAPPENFVVSLKPGATTVTVDARSPLVPARAPRRWRLALTVLAVTLGLAGAAWVYLPLPAAAVPEVKVVEAKPEPPPPTPPPTPPPAVVVPEPEAPRPVKARATPKPAPAAAPMPAGTGTLALKTTPWTKVSIDGQPVGSTPLVRKLSAGEHRLEVANEAENVSLSRTITITPDATLKLDLPLQPK